MLLYRSFLYKMLFHKGIHIHFISQNCKVESKIKHSLHYNIYADNGTLNKEKMSFKLYLSIQNCLPRVPEVFLALFYKDVLCEDSKPETGMKSLWHPG